MFGAKRLLTLFCGIALLGAVQSSEVTDSFEVATSTFDSLPSDIVGSLIAAAEEEELMAENQDAEEAGEDYPFVVVRPQRKYHRTLYRPEPRTIVVGAEAIPKLLRSIPKRLRWVPARYPQIVVNPLLARRLLATLYRSKPENVYKILRALPYPARFALRRLIAAAADPKNYQQVVKAFLTPYTGYTTYQIAMLENGEEVVNNEEEQSFVEVEGPNGALELLAGSLETQAAALEAQINTLKEKALKFRPQAYLKRKRGPLGRIATHPSRVVNPDGMHSWEAVAKANALTGEAGNKPVGSPIPTAHAEYLSVVALPRD